MSHHHRNTVKVPGGKTMAYYGALDGFITIFAALMYWIAFGIWVAGLSLYRMISRKLHKR